jgi:hypothetical protein
MEKLTTSDSKYDIIQKSELQVQSNLKPSEIKDRKSEQSENKGEIKCGFVSNFLFYLKITFSDFKFRL